VMAACSGAGMRAASEAARILLEISLFPYSCLLICGFAGGLAADMPPGGLIVPDRVTSNDHNASPESYSADPRLLAVAESISLPGIPIRHGALHTTNRILITPGEKKAMADRTGALAVDMETAGAVRMAVARNIPWLAVRAITDTVDQEMPFDFNRLADDDGNVDRSRVVLAALTHPWKIPGLLRLGTHSARAARHLAAFIEAFVKHLPH